MNVVFCASRGFSSDQDRRTGRCRLQPAQRTGRLGVDVRLALPAHRTVLGSVGQLQVLGWLKLSGGPKYGCFRPHTRRWQRHCGWSISRNISIGRVIPTPTRPARTGTTTPGAVHAVQWAVSRLAMDELGLGWRADVVHANDANRPGAGVPGIAGGRPFAVHRIHNPAYDCQFDFGTFHSMHLPGHWWSVDGGEYYGRFRCSKPGWCSTT